MVGISDSLPGATADPALSVATADLDLSVVTADHAFDASDDGAFDASDHGALDTADDGAFDAPDYGAFDTPDALAHVVIVLTWQRLPPLIMFIQNLIKGEPSRPTPR